MPESSRRKITERHRPSHCEKHVEFKLKVDNKNSGTVRWRERIYLTSAWLSPVVTGLLLCTITELCAWKCVHSWVHTHCITVWKAVCKFLRHTLPEVYYANFSPRQKLEFQWVCLFLKIKMMSPCLVDCRSAAFSFHFIFFCKMGSYLLIYLWIFHLVIFPLVMLWFCYVHLIHMILVVMWQNTCAMSQHLYVYISTVYLPGCVYVIGFLSIKNCLVIT